MSDSIQLALESTVKSTIPDLPEKGALVLDIDVDYRKYPQLRDFYGLAWQVESSENAKEISDVQWDYSSLVSTGSGINDFKLRLSNNSEVKEVKVQPVISREERARLEKEYAKARVEVEKAKSLALENANIQYNKMYEFQRNLSVNGFGIYNCDRVIQYEQPVAIQPIYKVNGEVLNSFTNYYLISNDNSAVSQYSNAIKLDLNRKNSLLFVLPDGKIAYATNGQLNEVVQQTRMGKEKQSIDLRISSLPIKTPEDLSALLNRI